VAIPSRYHQDCLIILLFYIEVLLEADADVNIKEEKSGFTALMYASTFGYIDIVRKLLQAGADVHEKGPKGTTAISAAAEGDHTEIVHLLKSAGAKE